MGNLGVQAEKRCYLCGAAEKLTRDHVPPKGLFPRPRPSNLHTIPCCFSCNNKASKDVEYFRLAASTLINRNPQGKRIWERVVEHTLTSGRIKDLIKDLRNRTRPTRIETPTGVIEASEFSFTAEHINRVLVRTTRGFLSLWHTEVDGSGLDFEISQIHQFKLESIATSGVTSKFTAYAMGDGVYRHWRGLATEDHRRGLWVHLFYDAAAWMVMHTEGDGRITIHGAKDWEQRL
jgi:hypothetical protein